MSAVPIPEPAAIEVPAAVDVQTILCPIDWSEPSLAALQAAVHLARHEGARLLILHVLPPLGMVRGLRSVASLQRSVAAEARDRLAALIAERVPDDVQATALVRVGEEAEEIHLAALDADVVVMSTHGRGAWERWAFGSVAESVLRGATCPIYVVGPARGDPDANQGDGRNDARSDGRGSCFDFPYKQVLWPTDWSAPSERALDPALAIAKQHGAQLLMLHVIEAPEPADKAWKHRQHAEVETQFRKLGARKTLPEGAKRLISRGEAAGEIVRVARAEGADLVVMSSRGRSGWGRLKLGGVAQNVLRLVPCPVFLVPPPAAPSLDAPAMDAPAPALNASAPDADASIAAVFVG